MIGTEHERSTSLPEMPPAGPTAKPHIAEILVAPWNRISVMFRSVHAKKTGETGSIWYWRPMSPFRMDLCDSDEDPYREQAASNAVTQTV